MKKRIVTILLAVCMLAGMTAALAACGEDDPVPESDPYSQYLFTVDEGGASLTLNVVHKSLLPSGDLVLPQSTYWYADAGSTENTRHETALPVANVADGAFENCGSITSVTIGETYLALGEDCFRGCTALTDVVLSSKVTEIPDGAFAECGELVNFSSGSTERITLTRVGDEAFDSCLSLRKFDADFGAGTKIGSKAFFYTVSISRIDLTDVTEVGSRAFAGWLDTQEIVLPASVSNWAPDWK